MSHTAPHWNGKLNWLNILFITITPALAIVLIPYSLVEFGFHPLDLGNFFLFAILSGISITAGYHRLFSHRSYQTSPIIKAFYLFFGAGTFQNSAYVWASNHRYHHQHVDTDADPYSIKRGFWWAHFLWIFREDPEGRSYDNIEDLKRDPLVMLQDKYYILLGGLSGVLLPALVGGLYGRFWEGMLWGGLLKIVMVHHGTFLINSAAHTFGSQNFSQSDSSRNSWFLSLFTFGEGYHNFHHTFAGDYRNGCRWYHWDPSKWLIYTLNQVGLAWGLQRTPDRVILIKEMKHDNARTVAALNSLPDRFSKPLKEKIESARRSAETALTELAKKRNSYLKWVRDSKSKITRDQFKAQKASWSEAIKQMRIESKESIREYRRLIRQLNRQYSTT